MPRHFHPGIPGNPITVFDGTAADAARIEAATLQRQAEMLVMTDAHAAARSEVVLRVVGLVVGPLDDSEVHLVKMAAALAQVVPATMLTGS